MNHDDLLSAVRRLLNAPPDAVVECRELLVTAAESQIYEVVLDAEYAPGGSAVHAALKQFKVPDGGRRVRTDAELLERLHRRGVSVPRVLGASADDGLLLLEWAGPVTLADLLKADGSVGAAVWEAVLAELAKLHMALNEELCGRRQVPQWTFTGPQRLEWAIAGLGEWRRWLAEERIDKLPTAADDKVASCAARLASYPMDRIIWGDCNPKNVMMHGGRPCFIDFQAKRSSPMLDVVLLFTFADEPSTYVPRAEAHQFLSSCHGLAGMESAARTAFSDWYDDELLWRLLVYGGNLLRGRESRNRHWSAVCRKMLPDLEALVGFDRSGCVAQRPMEE